MKNFANDIAASMDAFLNDPKNRELYAPYGLNKVAFTKVSDESKPTELEVEIAEELSKSLDPVQASEGCSKCNASGCFSSDECKENCACGCKSDKKATAMDNEDKLVKSAFDALMKVSEDLETAGYETLSANALVLVNHLIVEAKAKKNKKDENKAKDKAKMKAKEQAAKEKEKAEKEKARAKAEKDKNAAKDKAMKEKSKLEAEKNKSKKK